MAQLIALTVSKRTPSPGNPKVINPSEVYGFDFEDIVVPIRRNAANTASYFTARQMKGSVAGGSDNNGRADYEVSESLAAIAAMDPNLLLLTVVTRRGVDMASEQIVFVASRISENLKTVATGTQFFYNEDGDPLAVEYIVGETITAIASANSADCCGNKTPVQINGVGGFPAAWDYEEGFNAYITLTANKALVITNAAIGDYGTLKIIQGAGAPYTLTLPAGSVVGPSGGGVLVLSAVAGEHDMASWYMDELGVLNWTMTPNFN